MSKKNYFTVKIIGLLCLAICGTGLLYTLLSTSPASEPNDTPQETREETSQEAREEAPQANKTPSLAEDTVDQVPEANLSADSPDSDKSMLSMLIVIVLVVCWRFKNLIR